MTDTKQVTVLLHQGLLNLNGDPLRNNTKETRSREELSKLTPKEYDAGLPEMTFGDALSLTLGNKTDCANVAEAAKFYRLSAKIHNKKITGKGEWITDFTELKDLKECLDTIIPTANFAVNIVMHGQIYSILEENIAKVVS